MFSFLLRGVPLALFKAQVKRKLGYAGGCPYIQFVTTSKAPVRKYGIRRGHTP